MSIQQTADTAQATLRDFEDTDVMRQIREMDKPYQSERVLRAMYWGAAMSLREIAERFDVNPKTIRDWMKRHGIKTRSKVEGLQLRELRDGDLHHNTESGKFGKGSSDTSQWSFRD